MNYPDFLDCTTQCEKGFYILDLRNLPNITLNVTRGFQKKRERPAAAPFLTWNRIRYQLLLIISGSRSVKFDLDFLRQSFVVFAQNRNDLIPAEVIRQFATFREHFAQHGAAEQYPIFFCVGTGSQ